MQSKLKNSGVKQNMRFLFVVLGYIEADRPGISGGDIRWLKFASYLVRQGHEVTVFATENCQRFTAKYDSQIGFVSAGNLGPLNAAGGLKRMWAAVRTLNLVKGQYDHVYSVTTYSYDAFPGLLLKWRRKARWTSVCHWLGPLFGRQTSFLSALLLFLGKRLGVLMATTADKILCVSEPTREKVLRFPFIRKARVHGVECGVEMALAQNPTKPRGQFTAAHIKRVAKTEGTYDLPIIWKKVVQRFPEAKIVICGDGSKDEVDGLLRLIKENGLEANMDYRGPVYDDVVKFGILDEARCFVLPSYEENWAIVLGEALASGLRNDAATISPDIRPVWGDALHWIPLANTDAFAERICQVFAGKVPRRISPAIRGEKLGRRLRPGTRPDEPAPTLEIKPVQRIKVLVVFGTPRPRRSKWPRFARALLALAPTSWKQSCATPASTARWSAHPFLFQNRARRSGWGS